MARTAFTVRLVVGGATYTVPTGKKAVFSVMIDNSQNADLYINSVKQIQLIPNMGATNGLYKPFAANGTDVISVSNGSSGNAATLNGFLYDT